MQRVGCTVAVLIYAAAAIHAWLVLPGSQSFKATFILIFPIIYGLAALVVPLQFRPLRRRLKHYVWLSFSAGFGQTPLSVLGGLGLVGIAAAFIYVQTAAAVHGGRFPAGAFSAYGAGVGVLFAQALLVSALEREPKVRALIEDRG